MVTPFSLWLSSIRRFRWCGDPSKIPTHYDEVLAALPALRAAFDAPSARVREGSFSAAGDSGGAWRIESPHPYVRVFLVPTTATWCAEEIRKPTPPVAIPVPPGHSEFYPDAALPAALEGLADASSSTLETEQWSPQPIERVHEWLDAAAEYLTRQQEILSELADWAEETATLDWWKAGNAGRIARAVPAQMRAMRRLVEAGADYERVLAEVRIAIRRAPYPVSNPETVLLDWANEQTWLVVKDAERARMVVCREDAFDQDLLSHESWDSTEVTVRGLRHRLASMAELHSRLLVEQSDAAEDAVEVVWDERSIDMCDREIAEFWAGLDAEHDLPGDFASVWKAFFGYDHRSVLARHATGTWEVGGIRHSATLRRRDRYEAAGAGDGGIFIGTVIVTESEPYGGSGSDGGGGDGGGSGGGDGGSGGDGGGGGGGGCGGGG